MASSLFGSVARNLCYRGIPNAASTAQRVSIPTRQLFLNPAKRASKFNFNSNFTTTARRAQESTKASNAATTAPAAAAPAASTKLGPLATFVKWYGQKNTSSPYRTQFISSLVIFFTGDIVAQYLGGEEYDYKRTLRVLAISAGSSIVIFKWFLFIGRNFNYASKLRTLVTKVGVNQIVYAPVFGTYYFTMQGFLSGDSADKVWERVKVAMPVSVKNSWLFWPPITAIVFRFVPPMYNAIVLSCVTTGWQAYLSWLNRKTDKSEVKELPAVASVTK